MSKNNDKSIFKPYGDVYWDRSHHCYNIFGMEITPELLRAIAEGSLHKKHLKFEYGIKDRTYTATGYTGIRAKLERLIEEGPDPVVFEDEEIHGALKLWLNEIKKQVQYEQK